MKEVVKCEEATRCCEHRIKVERVASGSGES